MLKTLFSRFNFWTTLFSKIMPNFWWTDIPSRRGSLLSSNPIFISSANYFQVFDSFHLIKVWILLKCRLNWRVNRKKKSCHFSKNEYRISANSFRGNYSFLKVEVRKLFKGGNYSRVETIRGNTVFK